jgi:hypothetical protein
VPRYRRFAIASTRAVTALSKRHIAGSSGSEVGLWPQTFDEDPKGRREA